MIATPPGQDLPPVVEPGLLTADASALEGSRCDACVTVRFPAARICADCQSRDVTAVPLSTRGRIFTFAVVRAPPPGYVGTTPYTVGIVELPEGLRVTTTLIATDDEAVAIGQDATFEPLVLGSGDDAVTSFAYRIVNGAKS